MAKFEYGDRVVVVEGDSVVNVGDKGMIVDRNYSEVPAVLFDSGNIRYMVESELEHDDSGAERGRIEALTIEVAELRGLLQETLSVCRELSKEHAEMVRKMNRLAGR